jgi:hypothetical protein
MPVQRLVRRAFALAAVAATVALVPTTAAASLGEYRYAGLVGNDTSGGVRARIAAAVAPRVQAGHVAAWIGVGGRGAGPGGEDEWLQVGLASFEATTTRLYYEAMVDGQHRYVELDTDVAPGEVKRVAVTEMLAQPEWWRVWVDGRPVTEPIHLPGSHAAWEPVTVAETWTAEEGAPPHAFHFRFRGIASRGRGGRWTGLREPFVLEDRGLRVLRAASQRFDAVRAPGAAGR